MIKPGVVEAVVIGGLSIIGAVLAGVVMFSNVDMPYELSTKLMVQFLSQYCVVTSPIILITIIYDLWYYSKKAE
jgi:hypothetical protein